MLQITEEDYKELINIFESYEKLNELALESEKYIERKTALDNRFYGMNLHQEHDIIHAELEIGNVIIENDILTCIHDNALHRYKMVHRKASNGELVYITNATDFVPFNKRYIGRCFRVDTQPTKDELEWIKDFVGINLDGLDTGWCLYDDQYVVLEEIF